MADEYRIVDIWVGTFASEGDLEAYLAESYDEDDDAPISRFAADQGETFLDHDLMESSFHETPGDLSSLLTDHSFERSYREAACAAFGRSGAPPANAVVLAFGAEVDAPRSASDASHSLTYLGRFPCDPRS